MKREAGKQRASKSVLAFLSKVAALTLAALGSNLMAAPCARTITANVVALDQPLMFNRLGAQNINGMVFGLRRDVVLRTTVGGVAALTPITQTALTDAQLAGNVQLRPDKRPRPLVLRVAEGDCLNVNFSNLLTASANQFNPPVAGLPPFNLITDEQVTDRAASFHAQGMQLRALGGIANDGSLAGNTPAPGGIVNPGGSAVYRLYAERRGSYVIQSYGATFGSEGTQGNTANGLFGAISVEPSSKTAGRFTRFYRSQLTEEEMRLAADKNGDGIIGCPTPTTTCDATERTAAGQPILNYEKLYPNVAPWTAEGKAGLPIVNILTAANEIVHSDINAIIAGPNADGSFDANTYPLESVGKRNPALPNRLEAFREYTVIFHDEVSGAQVFPKWYDKKLFPEFGYVLEGVKDGFMINYGSGGIGSEIIANRLGVGPMHDCLDCSYEEFFLTSYTVGDPAMVTDVPANFGLENCAPPPGLAGCTAVGPKATEAFYPDDPSNVHHSYTNDRVVFRNLHVGKEQHIFHLHNHQWLYNPNDDNSNYLDAQGIGPGASYTYEINYGGSGNRNKTSGDAIFHCHFYPHFAQGMWEFWRNHDVMETGTPLQVTLNGGMYHTTAFGLMHGQPALVDTIAVLKAAGAPVGARARALPDGEVVAGTPIPAIVPLPGKGMPIMPGKVNVVPKVSAGVQVGSNAFVERPTLPNGTAVPGAVYAAGPGVASQIVGKIKNPGYPFWIAGIEDTVGQRISSPPLDMDSAAGGWDGGLPRHTLDGVKAAGAGAYASTVHKRDFTKQINKAAAVFYPEGGTDVEKAVMDFHGLVRLHPTYALNLAGPSPTAANFTTNGYRDYTIGNGGTATNPSPVQPGSPFHEPCIDDTGKRLMTGITGSFFGGATPTDMSVTGKSVFNASTPRVYQGVNIQFDAILNKAGYHYPQERITALWADAVPTITKVKPPEPFVMRLNTFDCAMYQHTNLVPEFYEMDDFQVRTPTDIIGQHIHLVKWDLTTTDGSANGWNYEDGTLSPGAVRERIAAINAGSKKAGTGSGTSFDAAMTAALNASLLTAKAHPFFGGAGPGNVDWTGARVTLERWFADPLVNTNGDDRGLGIIFTHDHYGPSSHQQIGLYSTVLAEPAGSTWKHNETGVQLGCNFPGDPGCRTDGGPTSWQAAIIPPSTAPAGTNVGSQKLDPYREFYFEFTDFQHAYEKGVYVGAGPLGNPLGETTAGTPTPGFFANLGGAPQGGPSALANTFRWAINPPGRTQITPVFPDLVLEAKGGVLPGCPDRPCPTAISVQDPGVLVVNYRQEPVGLRVFDPNKLGPDGKPGAQADGIAGDLAYALSSEHLNKNGTILPINRAIPELNKKDCNGGPNSNCLNFWQQPLNQPTGVDPTDPFTPMMRAYTGDMVRVKIQAGGNEEEHNATIHGLKWLQAGSGHGKAPNSGWRNGQAAGISEQFTLSMPVLDFPGQIKAPFKDYAYSVDTSQDGWWSGMWGLMRQYDEKRQDLFALPSNPNPTKPNIVNRANFKGVCPANPSTGVPLNLRQYDVVAILANDLLPNNTRVTIPFVNDPVTGLPLNTTHNGGLLNPAGGTLVYNSRTTAVQAPVNDLGVVVGTPHNGPIHDPTAILYERLGDLQMTNPNRPACQNNAVPGIPGKANENCPVTLKPGKNVEPLILRAVAGDCVEVTLYNRLPALMPDLPGFSTLQGVVKRDRLNLQGSTTFNNNLIRPSNKVGLHAQLVTLDVTKDDGANVGQNLEQIVTPATGDKEVYRWYAGEVTATQVAGGVILDATPVEFGGSGLMPADKIKQGQKSLVGGLSILPHGVASFTEDDGTGSVNVADGHQAATYTHPLTGKTVRDFMVVMTKDVSQYFADSYAVPHINGEAVGIPEDSQDSTGMALNYGIEPLWFRFGLPPNASFGHQTGGFGAPVNAHLAYSNSLVGGNPQTPVFAVNAGDEVRMHIAVPHGTSRGSTFHIHGHVWQRDPYICPNQSRNGLSGACTMGGVGSRAIGENPMGFGQGGQESINSYSHFTFRLPSAGGVDRVTGDYLFRDQASFGNTSGLWGILRVK